ncbi:hypothetical protein BDK92_2289 [Micromonospora pisi]|uniref:Uncharacterized protein n=1 Tax=Micromonospora pisi TaxID=589240 RepID=A0A495JG54_9ACTN|nr:hypothetical protein [Micromonospora pisi]RKR87986.1 hypothetical protein BDK92_2289 [Micromonospora pisi]
MTTPESTDALAGAAIERLTPYLPAVGTTGPDTPGVDSAARSLHRTVAARLHALGETEALAEFVRQPRNNSLVRRLLATAIREDPAYAAELAAAVAAVPPPSAASQTPAGPATATAAATPTPAPPGTGRRFSRRALLIGLTVVVVAVAVVCLIARNILGDLDDSGGLTSQSSCADFRQAPREDRMRALQAIALARGVPELDSPFGLTAVTEACATQPERRVGDVVASFRD